MLDTAAAGQQETLASIQKMNEEIRFWEELNPARVIVHELISGSKQPFDEETQRIVDKIRNDEKVMQERINMFKTLLNLKDQIARKEEEEQRKEENMEKRNCMPFPNSPIELLICEKEEIDWEKAIKLYREKERKGKN